MRKPAGRSRITNGGALLPFTDGRTFWVRRYRSLVAVHLADLAGEDNCSEAEKSLVRRVACIEVELERLEMLFAEGVEDGGNGHDNSGQGREGRLHRLETYQRAANTLRRLLSTIGIRRRARDVTPTLDEYLELRAQEAGEEERDE